MERDLIRSRKTKRWLIDTKRAVHSVVRPFTAQLHVFPFVRISLSLWFIDTTKNRETNGEQRENGEAKEVKRSSRGGRRFPSYPPSRGETKRAIKVGPRYKSRCRARTSNGFGRDKHTHTATGCDNAVSSFLCLLRSHLSRCSPLGIVREPLDPLR